MNKAVSSMDNSKDEIDYELVEKYIREDEEEDRKLRKQNSRFMRRCSIATLIITSLTILTTVVCMLLGLCTGQWRI